MLSSVIPPPELDGNRPREDTANAVVPTAPLLRDERKVPVPRRLVCGYGNWWSVVVAGLTRDRAYRAQNRGKNLAYLLVLITIASSGESVRGKPPVTAGGSRASY
jgi:hypothetical protein